MKVKNKVSWFTVGCAVIIDWNIPETYKKILENAFLSVTRIMGKIRKFGHVDSFPAIFMNL